jgi:DNA-binding SARP family transcriptional activator
MSSRLAQMPPSSAVDGSGRARSDRVELSLLRGFALRINGDTVALPLGSQRLIAFIALRMRPVLRIYAAGTLWPDSSDRHAAACLRSALWRTNRAGAKAAQATATHIGLADGVAVDAWSQAEAARRLIRGTAEDTDLIDPSPSLDLLPGWYDDWLLIERERFRQLGLHALEALCWRHLAAGRLAEAVDAGVAAVAAEPLRSSAQQVLIRAHLAEGNWCEAIRQFGFYRSALADTLGIEPSFSLEELATQP